MVLLASLLGLLCGCIDGFRWSAFSPFPPGSKTKGTNSPRAGEVFIEAPKAGPMEFQKETVVYRQAGGIAIKADVHYFPRETKRPAIVSWHGGALINGHRASVSRSVHEFALTNHYVIVSFDYRLAPETKLPEIIADVEAAFAWLRKEGARFGIDTDRIAVTGNSAGGYLTLVCGHRIQPRPRALLAYSGYGDLIGDWYSKPSSRARHNIRKIGEDEAWAQVKGPAVSDPRDRKGDGGIFYNYCRQTGTWPKAVSGWDPATEAEKFFPFMPVKNVARDFPPTVLIHGTADTDVPFEQSELMAQEFAKHGVAHQLHSIANAEHGLIGGDPASIRDAEQKAFDLVKERLEADAAR